jgi:hypothetical protein
MSVNQFEEDFPKILNTIQRFQEIFDAFGMVNNFYAVTKYLNFVNRCTDKMGIKRISFDDPRMSELAEKCGYPPLKEYKNSITYCIQNFENIFKIEINSFSLPFIVLSYEVNSTNGERSITLRNLYCTYYITPNELKKFIEKLKSRLEL